MNVNPLGFSVSIQGIGKIGKQINVCLIKQIIGSFSQNRNSCYDNYRTENQGHRTIYPSYAGEIQQYQSGN